MDKHTKRKDENAGSDDNPERFKRIKQSLHLSKNKKVLFLKRLLALICKKLLKGIGIIFLT
jgi:hypothetical protein